MLGDLKEITFDVKDATDEAAGAVADMARETADAVFPVGDLTDCEVENLTRRRRTHGLTLGYGQTKPHAGRVVK